MNLESCVLWQVFQYEEAREECWQKTGKLIDLTDHVTTAHLEGINFIYLKSDTQVHLGQTLSHNEGYLVIT